MYFTEEIQREVQAEMEIRRQMEKEIQALKGKN
jgi:hypothetical protein